MNISGVVVRTAPGRVTAVCEQLRKSGLCDIHAVEVQTGKIIITIEGDSVKEETRKLEQIQKIEGVFTADMAYAYSDEAFNKSNMSRGQKEPKTE